MSNTVGFSVSDAKRIADTVKTVERDRPSIDNRPAKNGSVDDFVWAEITAVGDSSNAGRYEWSAIQFDSTGDSTANSNYGSGSFTSNWAIEVNGDDFEVGDKVLLRPSYEQEYMVGRAAGSSPAETYIGKTTETITALSGSTAGSGAVQIYQCDATSFALTTAPDSVGDVINLSDSTIGSGEWVSLVHEPYSDKFVAVTGGGGDGACTAQNAIIQITIFGSPTGGTLSLNWTIDGTSDTLTFDSTADNGAFKTELLTHPSIDSTADVEVTGGPFPDATMQVEFTGDLGGADIALPLSNWGALTGGTGVGCIQSYAQVGI